VPQPAAVTSVTVISISPAKVQNIVKALSAVRGRHKHHQLRAGAARRLGLFGEAARRGRRPSSRATRCRNCRIMRLVQLL
jgi:hypothetical protein